MALKFFTSMNINVSLLLLICIKSFCTSVPPHPNDEKPSLSDFAKTLKGYQKGVYASGIRELKQYLNTFGYVNYRSDDSHANDDYFDDLVEDAIRKYQQNFSLHVTGTLNIETLFKMAESRCGVPDIINGKTRMGHPHASGNATIHITSRYDFYEGDPKWPRDKFHLLVKFYDNVNPEYKKAILRAFDEWASFTQFKFSETSDISHGDIQIGFYKRDHHDGQPFDGPMGILAHAAPPTYGLLHFDAEEEWSIGGHPHKVDVETVAMHEIGHVLGLGHSSVENAIMYPTIPMGITKGLEDDDIKGIKALYSS